MRIACILMFSLWELCRAILQLFSSATREIAAEDIHAILPPQREILDHVARRQQLPLSRLLLDVFQVR